MLDLGSVTAMPIKETSVAPSTVPSKPDDSLGGPKSTPKRSPSGDLKDTLLKGGPPVVGNGDGELMLEITCGQNQAALYMSRLQLGSKGTCVLFENSWLTPNEFQYISGRETAKDWKRSIKHHGKSLKVLISKAILTTSPLRCNCGQCTQSKDKDVSKCIIVTDDVKMTPVTALRDVFVTDPSKLVKSQETAKDQSDRRFSCAPSESNETTKGSTSVEQCLASYSQGGARHASSCDKGVYRSDKGVFGSDKGVHGSGSGQEDSFRLYSKQEVNGAYQVLGTRVGQVGHLANDGQTNLSSEDKETKLKTKKKPEYEELPKEGTKFVQNGDQRKTGNEINKSDVTESTASGVTSQKRSTSSGTKPTPEAVGTWGQSSSNYHVESSYHSEPVGAKPSPHDKIRKSNSSSSSQPMPSCNTDKPSCGQVITSPSGKNSSSSNTGSTSDRTRHPPSESSSFMFPSFGSPYYPMIPAPQIPAYYPSPYMWPMSFPANPSPCSYGWTAPSDLAAPNCLRSPVKDSIECGTTNPDQAFNFPWMKKRSGYTTMDRDSTNDTASSGKRKSDCEASDHFPPSKHPLYLSDSLRSTYGESIGWPGYNPSPSAAALDFRFLPYNIPSYIPDIRPTHGLFTSNFLKGSENPSSPGFGLYPGLFPSPCLGVNSR